jgi:hypothetical protein
MIGCALAGVEGKRHPSSNGSHGLQRVVEMDLNPLVLDPGEHLLGDSLHAALDAPELRAHLQHRDPREHPAGRAGILMDHMEEAAVIRDVFDGIRTEDVAQDVPQSLLPQGPISMPPPAPEFFQLLGREAHQLRLRFSQHASNRPREELQGIQVSLVGGEIIFCPPLPHGRRVVLGERLRLQVQIAEELSHHRLVHRIEAHGAVFCLESFHRNGFDFPSDAIGRFQESEAHPRRSMEAAIQPGNPAAHDDQVIVPHAVHASPLAEEATSLKAPFASYSIGFVVFSSITRITARIPAWSTTNSVPSRSPRLRRLRRFSRWLWRCALEYSPQATGEVNGARQAEDKQKYPQRHDDPPTLLGSMALDYLGIADDPGPRGRNLSPLHRSISEPEQVDTQREHAEKEEGKQNLQGPQRRLWFLPRDVLPL